MTCRFAAWWRPLCASTIKAFSVYLHLPYCRRKCPYCDFNTYAVATVPESDYCAALMREMSWWADQPQWQGRGVDSVFFGGGTPSLFGPTAIGSLLEHLDKLFGLDDSAEVTLEANPGSLEGGGLERLQGFHGAGVNRLSLGGQSFNDRHLKILGRLHNAADTRAALAAARKAGFDDLSCDLIFAVPEQTVAEWRSDLECLVDVGVDHVSAYNLTYEQGTPMTAMVADGRLEAAGNDREADMYDLAIDLLGQSGYGQYEISNFARPGHRSRHNLAYWSWRDYLGLGAGAHGFWRQTAGDGAVRDGATAGHRYKDLRLPALYMAAKDGGWTEESESLSRDQASSEFIMLGLRLSDGLEEAEFARTFGVELATAAPSLGQMCSGGLVEREGGRVRLTRRGLMLADSVIPQLAVGGGA